MIEKVFVNTNCISCGKETPVIFHVKDVTGYTLYRIPLCRDCSNMFAEDKLNALSNKLEKSKKANIQLVKDNINLKRKVRQMNIKSHNHKEKINELSNINNRSK